MRDAIKRLTNLGLVETKPGQGTFVVQKINPFVTTLTGDARTGQGRTSKLPVAGEQGEQGADFSPVQVEIQEASEEIPRALEIPMRAEVISRHERRFIDGSPWSMQTSHYPMEFADRGADDSEGPETSTREPFVL